MAKYVCFRCVLPLSAIVMSCLLMTTRALRDNVDNKFGDTTQVGKSGTTVITNESGNHPKLEEMTSKHKGKCQTYIAKSTIPNAGLGVFTAVRKEIGDVIGNGDVCLPLIDMGRHNGNDYFDPFKIMYVCQVWAGEVMGMKQEVEGLDIEAYCPGLDCAINCNLALVNVGKSTPSYDEAGLHRSQHPGAGAITPYHNGTTKVTRAIPAGGELFKFYGDSWFSTREHIFATIPLSDDYTRAQTLLEQYNTVGGNRSLYDLLVNIRYVWNSRTLNALPNTYEEALLALKEDIGATHQPNATRSLEWLAEHGHCVDNIVPRQSTVQGAGRGAFAKRALPKDTIITGSPLHHLPFGRDVVKMYSSEWYAGNQWTKTYKVIGKQLFLNYCFGHDESSILLCPYGAGVHYINHSSQKPNVEIQWADDGTLGHNQSWLEKIPEDMLVDTSTQLGIIYVATRDIQEGEELFLDYGDDWEMAWREHVDNWEPEEFWWQAYLNGHEWNAKFENLPLRTEDEAYYDPYPTTLQIRCHAGITGNKRMESYIWELSEFGYPCRILDRIYNDNWGDYVYTVEVTTEAQNRWDDVTIRTSLSTGIPREAIRFFDLPYTTDLHLKNTFRHEIGLPSNMLPITWRNRANHDDVNSTPIPRSPR